MGVLALENACLLDPESTGPRSGTLLIDGERIARILTPQQAPPRSARRVDLEGRFLAPGFVDLHYHGAGVLDDAVDPVACLRRASASLARHGTTAFLVTTVAWPREQLLPRVAALARVLEAEPWPGAQPIGIHLEGPWIRCEAAGAQPRAGIRPYDPGEGRDVLEGAGGLVRMVTLAPEIEGAPLLLRELARRGIVASLGHSRAEPAAIEAAIAEGLRHVTHLFNAMSAVHHRSLGVAGFALGDDRLSCDLICDGVHVHPAMVRVAARAKGERLLLVTDRVELGEPGSEGSFGSGPLRSVGGAVRLPDGSLAGSQLTLDVAIANLRRFTDAGPCEAVAAGTLRPARLLGLEAQRGTLRPGARADLAVLGPEGEVFETWVGGVVLPKDSGTRFVGV